MEKKSRKLIELEGLRGAAAFVVVLQHLVLTFDPHLIWHVTKWLRIEHQLSVPLSDWAVRPLEALHDGAFAVWLFWVMSGLVLSIQWFSITAKGDHSKAGVYLKKAFLRRYPRLFIPVLASIAFAYILHASGLMRNKELSETLQNPHPWLASFYSFEPSILDASRDAAWRTFFNFIDTKSYNAVTWTMEKELWGSYLVFGFLALVGRRTIRPLVYATLALAFYFIEIHWLNSFLIGMAIGDLYVLLNNTSWKLPARLGFSRKVYQLFNTKVAFILLVIVILFSVGAPIYTDTYHLTMAVIVCILTISLKPFRAFFSTPLFTYLGRISFGLYLIHLPLICSYTPAAYFFLIDRMSPAATITTSLLTTIALSIVCGHLLYLIGDRPSIRASKRFADRVYVLLARRLKKSPSES